LVKLIFDDDLHKNLVWISIKIYTCAIKNLLFVEN